MREGEHRTERMFGHMDLRTLDNDHLFGVVFVNRSQPRLIVESHPLALGRAMVDHTHK
jgi:hypothetical protein